MLVEILLPKTTFEPTLYKLKKPLHILGLEVPDGFVTDGASVPRALWWLFPPTGRYFLAAVVHDYLLSIGYSWNEALVYFRKTLQDTGVHPWVVTIMTKAVKWHGFVNRYK